MKWTERTKPGVPKFWLQLLAGVVWTGVGIYLISLAWGWILSPGVKARWLYWIPGLILASLIYYFGFSRLARKNSQRITDFTTEKPCLFAFQEWHSYPLVLFMIGLGLGLRQYTAIPKPLLGILYLGIDGGLGSASLHYYHEIIKNNPSHNCKGGSTDRVEIQCYYSKDRWNSISIWDLPTMRQFIRKIGLTKSILLFSFLAVCLALVSTLVITTVIKRWGIPLNLPVGLVISVIITLIITPLMSFYMVRLFLKVDRLEEEMRVLACYDSLTGLYNKREFLERADYFHKIASREKLPYSLIIADLDNFKKVNDHFGHLTGDQTLETLGLAIQESLRESDLACRFGGDEFLFFLPNTNSEQATHFTDRLRLILEEAIECSSLEIELTASMGIASYPEFQTESIEEFIAAADIAMYNAKNSGGNQSKIYALQAVL